MADANESDVWPFDGDRGRGFQKHFVILDWVESGDVADDLYIVSNVPLRANAAPLVFVGIKNIRVDPVGDEHHFFARQSAFGCVLQARHRIDRDTRRKSRESRLNPNGALLAPVG